jgi:hypothetical protein
MQMVPLMYDDRPLFCELMASVRDELKCNSNEDGILVEGVLHHGRSRTIFRRLVPIASEAQWDKYVKTVMKNEFQCLDLVVWKLSNEPTPHGYAPPNGHSPHGGFLPQPVNPAPSNPPLPDRKVDVEDEVVVPDAQSTPNEVGICVDNVAAGLQEIPLTQNDPSKWCSNTLPFLILPSFRSFVSIPSIYVI